MNEQRYPLLEELHVLRTSALCNIRDRAFDALPLYYEDYSDGIVSGCRLRTNQDAITVRPGIVRYDGFMYFLREPMTISYAPTEEYRMLKLKFGMPEESESFLTRSLRLELSDDMAVQENEMEFCRFKLKAGAVLRTKYVDFFDRMTEFDTVNFISAPYAAVGRSTLHPEILMAFATEAMEYRLDPLDQSFCVAALQNLPIAYEQIVFYLCHRLRVERQEWDNMGLYGGLCTALEEIKRNGRREVRQARRGRREVMVD